MKPIARLDLQQLLEQFYPQVYRTALMLCKSRPAGMAVAARVLSTSEILFDRWDTVVDAQRWFLRYTVQCSREDSGEIAAVVSADSLKDASRDTTEDALLAAAGDINTQAMIKALRYLPPQHREAFLLHHGEQLDLRQLATAMDCSSAAAANHLVAASEALRPLAIQGLVQFANQLPELLAAIVPSEAQVRVQIKELVARRRRRRLLSRLVWRPLRWIFLLGVGYMVWKFVQGF